MELLPAYDKLDKFIQNEYMLHLRPTPGISSINNGLDYYKACLEYHTSIEGITPEQVHQIGLRTVKSLL